MYETVFVTPWPWWAAGPAIGLGGLVGAGARWAGGCPSGPTFTGIAQGAWHLLGVIGADAQPASR